jgi:hypothetical protein
MPSFDNIRVALRDLFIVGLIVAFLAWPGIPERFIASLGVTHAELLGSKFDFQATVAQAEKVSRTKTDAEALVQALSVVKAEPAASAALSYAVGLAKAVRDGASSADAAVKDTLAQQQQQAPPGVAPQASDGWIYLGLADPTQQKWLSGQTTNAASPQPGSLAGQTLQITDTVYLRDGADAVPPTAPAGWRATQPILGALPRGQLVRVIRAEIDPTKAGGFAAWAQVAKVS